MTSEVGALFDSGTHTSPQPNLSRPPPPLRLQLIRNLRRNNRPQHCAYCLFGSPHAMRQLRVQQAGEVKEL